MNTKDEDPGLKTAEEKAYQRLRKLILSGELPTNEFLPQRMLAKKVGQALITVRAALRLLENDGLIENVPRWGVRIPVETIDDIRDRYFVREILEVAAARRTAEIHLRAPNSQDHQIKDEKKYRLLMDLAQRCDEMFQRCPEKFEEFATLHLEMHGTIASLASSPLLFEQIEKLNLKTFMLRTAKGTWREDSESSQHVRLIEELYSNDVDRAEEAMRAHVRSGLEIEEKAFEQEHPQQ